MTVRPAAHSARWADAGDCFCQLRVFTVVLIVLHAWEHLSPSRSRQY